MRARTIFRRRRSARRRTFSAPAYSGSCTHTERGDADVFTTGSACVSASSRIPPRCKFNARASERERRGEQRSTKWKLRGASRRERGGKDPPISILIELNATSYLMPETRQKLQLNGDAISLYLLVHPSGIAPASSLGLHGSQCPVNALARAPPAFMHA